MANKAATGEPAGAIEDSALRKCIGSKRYGIEAHEAPVEDFPIQPSQRDGLGRMCRTHWTQYTRALRTGSIEPKSKPAPEPFFKERRRRGATIGAAVAGGATIAEAEATVQSEAAARVAVKRAARVAAKGQAAPAKMAKRSKRPQVDAHIGTPAAMTEADVTAIVADSPLSSDPEQDTILIERKARVKAWRKSEIEGASAQAAAAARPGALRGFVPTAETYWPDGTPRTEPTEA